MEFGFFHIIPNLFAFAAGKFRGRSGNVLGGGVTGDLKVPVFDGAFTEAGFLEGLVFGKTFGGPSVCNLTSNTLRRVLMAV